MHKVIPFILIVFTIFSCNTEKSKQETGAWIGGEIINPNSKNVILTKNEKVIDTIALDNSNRFLYYIENVEKGIYNFLHQEYQMIYLKPSDSLMLRLNTLEFDESLAFTGKGAERNNYLINMFIYNEQESQRMRPFYQLPVEEFLLKMDSMRNLRLDNLDRFTQRANPCDEFLDIAKSNINYDYYGKKEIYPYAHLGRNNIIDIQLPDDYYDYFSELDYNNEDLQAYYTYYRYLVRHFDFLAHKAYQNEHPYDAESLIHIINKLKIIDEHVTLDGLKNSLLKTSIRRYIVNCKNASDEKEAIDLFFSLSTDESDIEEIRNISEVSLKLMPGNQLPKLTIIGVDNRQILFSSVIKKPTVLYFWSLNSMNHLRNVHSKVDELKVKYPEFDFLALNTNADKETWKRIINRHGYDKAYEYRFSDPNKAMDLLVINSINKTLILDENGEIIDNHTNLFNATFEEELLSLLNQ